MKPLTTGYLYRSASLDDASEIKEMLSEGLKDNKELAIPIRPTEKSVNNFFNLEVRPALINHDPTFLVYADSNRSPLEVVGFSCSSTCLNEVYDFPEKIGFGVITITTPLHRRKGLATKMRELGLEALKNKGCTKVLTDICDSNKASLDGCKNITDRHELKYNIISNKYECRI